MKKLIIYSLLLCFFCACEEKTSYQMRILIRNETDINLKLSLLPKAKYLYQGLYDYSEISGGYRNLIFEMKPGSEQELYVTRDLNIQPIKIKLT